MKNHVNLNVREVRDDHIAQVNQGLNVHDHLKHLSIPELQTLTQQTTHPFWVCCLNVLSDMNTATVIRSAHLMGAERVVVFGRRKIDNRGLVGAANYTHVEKVWGVDCNAEICAVQFEHYCKSQGVVPIFVEQGGTNVFAYDWLTHVNHILSQGLKPMLVMGTENSGIPESILSRAEEMGAHTVSIPQTGVIRSHNVSMAFAITAGQMVGAMGWY